MQTLRSLSVETLSRPPAPRREPPKGVWIIFDEPTGGYSAQRFYLGEFIRLTTAPKLVGSTLENVRALLPEGLTKMGPFEQSEPFVVEWWA